MNISGKGKGTFKENIIAILAELDKAFPMHFWDWLLPKEEMIINMSLATNIAPNILAYP